MYVHKICVSKRIWSEFQKKYSSFIMLMLFGMAETVIFIPRNDHDVFQVVDDYVALDSLEQVWPLALESHSGIK